MQTIAQYLSTTYVFEGMRALILNGEWLPELLWRAFLLNGIYFLVGVSVLHRFSVCETADFFFNQANKSVETYCLSKTADFPLSSSNRMGMKNMKKRYVVIMAGGRGERFWPQSRLA